MWRSLFLALGIFSLILGAETLIVDKFIMTGGRSRNIARGSADGLNPQFSPQTNLNGGYYQQASYQPYTATIAKPRNIASRIVQTRDWMPWSLLATGAIIVFYTCSLPKSHHNDGWGSREQLDDAGLGESINIVLGATAFWQKQSSHLCFPAFLSWAGRQSQYKSEPIKPANLAWIGLREGISIWSAMLRFSLAIILFGRTVIDNSCLWFDSCLFTNINLNNEFVRQVEIKAYPPSSFARVTPILRFDRWAFQGLTFKSLTIPLRHFWHGQAFQESDVARYCCESEQKKEITT